MGRLDITAKTTQVTGIKFINAQWEVKQNFRVRRSVVPKAAERNSGSAADNV